MVLTLLALWVRALHQVATEDEGGEGPKSHPMLWREALRPMAVVHVPQVALQEEEEEPLLQAAPNPNRTMLP